jgi:hypothetical protein
MRRWACGLQTQKAAVRATPAAANTSSVRLAGARSSPAPALFASRSSTALRAVKDYSAEEYFIAPSKTEVNTRYACVCAHHCPAQHSSKDRTGVCANPRGGTHTTLSHCVPPLPQVEPRAIYNAPLSRPSGRNALALPLKLASCGRALDVGPRPCRC